MKKNITQITLIAFIIIGVLGACSEEQDVADVRSTADYPVATFTTTSNVSSISEGDTVEYTITLDRPYFEQLVFGVNVTGDLVLDEDYTVWGGDMQGHETSTTLSIAFINDGFPEVAESMSIEVGAFGFDDRYVLNPTTVNPTFTGNVTNVNEANRLTVAFGWPSDDDDFDVFIWQGAAFWGQSAGSDNPEINTDIWGDDPDGTYYVSIDPWFLGAGSSDYTISVGHENGTVEVFNGHFDTADISGYTIDGGFAFRMLEIVKVGTDFTVTHVN